MGKTQKPLKILVMGPSAGQLFQDKKVQALIEKGDNVQIMEVEADCIMGETSYRTFPKTLKFTIAAIEGIRKAKPKPEKKVANGKGSKKGKGKTKPTKTKKPAKGQEAKAGTLQGEEP